MSPQTPFTPGLPGIDAELFARWFHEAVPGAGRPRSMRLIAGGKSNLTFEVTDGASVWIVRRPPLGHVLATAHDMAREYRVMTALRDTAVPVPAMIAACEDPVVLGAPFYVMERVEGIPYRFAEDLAVIGVERTRVVSERLVDTLVALHDVDPASVGLADFGRPDGFLERQLRRWMRQLEASRTRELPAADVLARRLAEMIPPQRPARIVHGDFRLDNVLVDADDRPAAVIDWEMATIGDPLTDLAMLLLYQRLGALVPGRTVTNASSAPGFLSETEIVERYETRCGLALPGFGFYLGLASLKLASVAEGIHHRHLQGQTVGEGFDHLGAVVEPLLESGLASLRGLP